MGWWSKSILGGDSPWDYCGDILHDICKIPQSTNKADFNCTAPNTWSNVERKVVREALDANIHIIDSNTSKKYMKDVYGQVWAILVMASGAKMTNLMRAFFIAAGEVDEWAAEDKGRKKHIDAYIALVRAYNGEIALATQKSLWDKMAEVL